MKKNVYLMNKKDPSKNIHPKWMNELDVKMEKIITEMEQIHERNNKFPFYRIPEV